MRWLGWLVMGLGIGPALAQGGAPPGSVHGGRIDCTCRAGGQSYAMGAKACLDTPRGWRLATCSMVQNVTSWAVGEESCVVSALPLEPQPLRISQR